MDPLGPEVAPVHESSRVESSKTPVSRVTAGVRTGSRTASVWADVCSRRNSTVAVESIVKKVGRLFSSTFGGYFLINLKTDLIYWVTTDSSLSSASDRKSTRLNSSHVAISYAVFCL